MLRRALAIALACTALTGVAAAETRVFVIANNADGYGVDRCLATGASCGAVVATSYCRSQQFDEVRSFRKVERDDVTGAVPNQPASSAEFVAIECAR